MLAVLPDAFGFTLDVWLAMHEDQKSARAIRVTYDHLAAALGEWTDRA